MNDINKKTINRLISIKKNVADLNGLSGQKLKDLPLEYKSKDYMVDINDSNEQAYIKKLAVTNDTTGIPPSELDQIINTDKNKKVIFERIHHILKKLLHK